MQERHVVGQPPRLAEVVRASSPPSRPRRGRPRSSPRSRASPPGRAARSARRGTAPRAAAPRPAPAPAAAARRPTAAAPAARPAPPARTAPAPRPRAPRAAARDSPRSASAWTRFASAVRRSSTGRWNTIACARAARSGSAQATRPSVGAISPWQSRSSRLLPAPFGPSTASSRPGRIVRSTPSSSRAPPRGEAEPLEPQRQRRDAPPSSRRPAGAQRADPVGPGVQRQRHASAGSPRAPPPAPRSPRLVSSVIAVVIVRVCPAMLPPTISTAPTSALARPKPGQHAGQQAEPPVPQQRRDRAQPRRARASAAARRIRPRGPRSRCASARRRWAGSARVCAMTIAVGVNRSPSAAERPGARQQQVDEQPRDHRRQAHQRVEQHDHGRRGPGNRASASAAPERQADEAAERHRRQRHRQRQPDDPGQLADRRRRSGQRRWRKAPSPQAPLQTRVEYGQNRLYAQERMICRNMGAMPCR